MSFMPSVIYAGCHNEPITLSVIMLSVVILKVVAPNSSVTKKIKFCEYGPNFWQIKLEDLGKLKILLICENINFKGEL